jgi:nitrate reductase delta subunit
MEVSGVINQSEFEKMRPLIQEFSNILLYPETLEIKKEDYPLIDSYTSKIKIHENMNEFFTYASKQSLLEQQQIYVETFDFSKKTPLHMTYVKYEDAKERGQILVQLKMMYEMFGLELNSNELSDYLPVMLEFLANVEWETSERLNQMMLIFAIIEDGTYFLYEELKKQDNPYSYLIQSIRILLKSCIEQEMEVNK